MVRIVTELDDDVEAVMRGSRVISGIVAASLLAGGESLTFPQLRTLVLIQTRPELNARALAETLDIHPSNASRLLERLVQSGLVERREAEGDRRQLALTLTPRGVHVVEAVMIHRRGAFRRILQTMPVDTRHRLGEALLAFADAAGETPGPLLPL
jgi:DNA-binding MarR family transcriptional regulator